MQSIPEYAHDSWCNTTHKAGPKECPRTIRINEDELEQTLQSALREQFTTQITNEDGSYKSIPDRAKYWTKVILRKADNTE